MKKIRALFELLRPELLFAAGICVIIGEIISLGKLPPLTEISLGFFWGVFLSAPAVVLNDLFDIEVDRINSPNRALPSGLISASSVIILTIITTLVGVVVSFFIGRSAVILYLSFWVIGFLYNWKLKEFGLLGNLSVSLSVAITIILGAIIVGEPWNRAVIIFALLVFMINLGEEIAADAMDIEGDKERNIKSIAILYGRKRALQISALLFIIAIILSLLPYLWGLFGIIYLIIVLLMDILILFFTVKLIKSKSKRRGNILIRRIYLSGLAGIILIILKIIFT